MIQHAGKPGHRLSNPKPFFSQFKKANAKRLTVADGEHYVDGHAEMRKFFAGLAMTVVLREKSAVDFVDLKGKTISDFYMETLDFPESDPGATRVVHLLDVIAQLPKFASLKEGAPMSFQMAFHFALLVDSLDQGNYTQSWRNSVVESFLAFKLSVAEARLHHRETRESRPYYERFGRLLSGSGSDTAEIIRLRHSFMLTQIYPKLGVVLRDESRLFDLLEREVIWNRDRGKCQNPSCTRPDRRVSFRDATIHHIVEHSAGGVTTLRNGVLICPECHTDRSGLQELASFFQSYIDRIYLSASQSADEATSADFETEAAEERSEASGGKIQVVIEWGALDIDRNVQTISERNDSETIVELLRVLLDAFGEPLKEQLIETPVIRFPLSTQPKMDFLNKARGRPYSYTQIPGTDLYFCANSGRMEKLARLKALFTRLTLPDGSEFPSDCITVSVQGGGPATPS